METAAERTFEVNGRRIYMSWHAYERMFERTFCRYDEEVRDRVIEALEQGYESKHMRHNRGKKNCVRETIIIHKEIRLHIRENEIVTVTPNDRYYYAA